MATFTLGKYEVLEELGFGGMGTVYKALDPVLDRLVALKTMFTQGTLTEENKRRFLREARSVARLQHPNIITVFEFGEVDGKPFIAMELLEGVGLGEAVAAGRLPDVESKLKVVDQLCRGLAYAHRRGVIHRDIKPSNVFLLRDGTVKVLDFGIARVEGGTAVTDGGVVLGTPHYMAPEQFRPAGVDHRVDMWAVGVLLYELVTGQRPFEGSSVPSLIYRIIHSPPPPVDALALGVPPALAGVIARALAKDPADRYPDLEAMADAITDAHLAADPDGRARLERLSERVDRTMAAESPTAGLRRPPAPEPTERYSVQEPGGALPLPPAPSPGVTSAGALLTGSRRGGLREAGAFGERLGLQVVKVDPAGQIVAVGGVDGSIRVWELETRMKVATLRSRVHLRTGHAAMVTALAFSPDGSLLASGHLDGAVDVWDVASGLEAPVTPRHEGAVSGVAFSADAAVLVSGGKDAVVKCWEMPALMAGEARRVLRRQPAEVTALVRSGDRIFTAHGNKVIRIEELESGRLLATLHGHPAAPGVLEVSPRGDLLVTGSRDGAVRVFGVEARAQLRLLEGHTRPVASLVFLAGGRRLAGVARDNQLLIWDVARGGEPVETDTGEADEAMTSLAVLGGGQRILCGLADGRMRVWERSA